MTGVSLYLDEDAMRTDLVLALRSRSVNVLTAREAGMTSRDDQAHLQLASEQGRALYSFNVGHFYGIHEAWVSSGRSHAGIILAEQKRYSVGEQMRRLLADHRVANTGFHAQQSRVPRRVGRALARRLTVFNPPQVTWRRAPGPAGAFPLRPTPSG